MISRPKLAQALGRDTYRGEHCKWDGTYERYVTTHKCVSCAKYREGVYSVRIMHAVDGRKEKEKAKAKEKTMHFEDI